MANLYDISDSLEWLVEESVDTETGEILEGEDLTKRFDELDMALDLKIENIACFIKNLEAESEAIKAEKKKLEQRAKSAENKSNWLKRYLDTYLKATTKDIDKYKFSTARCALSYRKSQSVDVVNQTEVPKEFIKTKIEESVDKTAVKNAIKSGKTVNGCQLVTNINLQIK